MYEERTVLSDLHELKKAVTRVSVHRGMFTPAELPRLLDMQTELENTVIAVVVAMYNSGYTWEVIASSVGITRQAAHSRWAKYVDSE